MVGQWATVFELVVIYTIAGHRERRAQQVRAQSTSTGATPIRLMMWADAKWWREGDLFISSLAVSIYHMCSACRVCEIN